MPSLSNYRLKIVGKGFEYKKGDLERDNVEVIGTVDDLDPFYYEDNMMIMPIFYGAGQKVKTAEAMMYGKIILATDEALEGYDTDEVQDVYRCNSKEEFISAIHIAEREHIYGVSSDVRRYFKTYLSYENVLARFREYEDARYSLDERSFNTAQNIQDRISVRRLNKNNDI